MKNTITINTATGEIVNKALPQTFKGNLVADPELTEVKIEGQEYPVKVAKFKMLVNPTDQNGVRIRDAKPKPYWVPQWRDQATNAMLTLKKGDFVQATGYENAREFTGSDGTKHTVYEIKGATVSLLRKATANRGNRA